MNFIKPHGLTSINSFKNATTATVHMMSRVLMSRANFSFVKLRNLCQNDLRRSVQEVVVARKETELRPLMTRIPERLRRQLERAADQNRRSMNAEIVHRLEESFQRVDTEKLIKSIAQVTATATAERFQAVGAIEQRPHDSSQNPDDTDQAP
jgi:hypothetical protein